MMEKEEIKAKIKRLIDIKNNLDKRILLNEYSILTVNSRKIYRRVLSQSYEEKDNIYKWNDVIGIRAIPFNFNHFFVFRDEGVEVVENDDISDFYSRDIDFDEIKKWKKIKEIYEGELGVYGLDEDGIVHYVPFIDNDMELWHGQDDVNNLKDIKKIEFEYNGRLYCIGNDGKVKSTSYIGDDDLSCWDEISQWSNIKSLDFINGRVVGIKNDGSLVATRYIEDGDNGTDVWNEIQDWKNVEYFDYSMESRILAISSYGEIYSTSSFQDNEEEESLYRIISNWDGIAYLWRIPDSFCMGLRYDGTVIITKKEEYKDENNICEMVEELTDIVYLCSDFWDAIVGVKSDGSVFGKGELMIDVIVDTEGMIMEI